MSSGSGVFVLKDERTLVPMQSVRFAAELDFQALLTRFPALLVGDQIDPENPRRFVLVKQEQAIGHASDPSRWSVDHFFLDQEGIPTLVEVKRQSDPRLRREVVGQMLDYAANCQAAWTMESMRAAFEATCQAAGASAEAVLGGLLDPTATAETFWTGVKTNLQAGRLRLLFVADEIPTELRRIVEFLNEQMDPAEVLAVELRQFAGEGLKTIVPVVFGRTQEAAGKKAAAPGARWTEERFLEKLGSKFPEREAAVGRAVLDWMKSTGLPLIYGTGREDGSVYPQLKPKGVQINPAYLSTEGRIWLQMGSLRGKPAFGDVEARRELLRRFGRVDASNLADADVDRWSTLPLAAIATDPRGVDKVLEAFDWIVQQVEAADR